MQVTPQQLRIGATTLGAGVLAAGATWAWAGADHAHPGRERVAAAGYAPGVLGLATALVAGPAALGARIIGRGPVAALGQATTIGLAAVAGMAVGTATARLAGADPRPAVYEDASLPPANAERASQEADQTWSKLDRTKSNLVVWVPGTMRHRVPREFAEGVTAALGSDTSLANMPARPNYQIPQGVADSAAALRELLVRLDEQRSPGQRILLAGESQGAWALGVAMQDPEVAAIVDRAVVWGNPGVSPHQFDGAGDGKVLELSDELDVVGRQVEGDAPMMLDGLADTFDGSWHQAWRVPAAMINNPYEASLIARTGVRVLLPGGFQRDPHNHREFMGAAARFLADAPVPGDD